MGCAFEGDDVKRLKMAGVRLNYRAWQNKGATCLTCTRPIEPVEFAYHQIGVCSYCAEAIANGWWLSHSGQYLTWGAQARVNGEPDKEKAPRVSRPRHPIPIELRAKVFARDNFQCVKCSSGSRLEADHVVPHVKGGDAVMENLQTLCKPCNLKKRARENAEFMAEALA